MLTKSDFKAKAVNAIANYPALTPLFNAGDPRILMQLEANATMLAMLSAQIEAASAEPFEKVRDATVLADAAMRGIIRKAVSAQVSILAKNDTTAPFTIESGRVITDTKGNNYVIATAVSVPENGGTATFEAVQVSVTNYVHTVSGSVPFYAIEIPPPEDNSFLSGLSVSDELGDYEYRDRYVNSLVGERVYHVEADDRQRVYVRFGWEKMVGTQPPDGTVISLTVARAKGVIAPAYGSPFTFDYVSNAQESAITLSMEALLFAGENPLDMAALRDLVKYPSIYDNNAVYLGEFDYLVRSQFGTVQFLSIWNESIEEKARVASVDNINTLFCAVLSTTGTELGLTETDPAAPIAPSFIVEADYTETQKAIKKVILAADDSYRVKFYTFVRSEIQMTIIAVVSTVYVASDVKSKIIETILADYGMTSPASKRGSNQPLYREIYALLKSKIPALSDGNADIKLEIAAPVGVLRPELWRYVTDASLSVSVSTANITLPSWGGRK